MAHWGAVRQKQSNNIYIPESSSQKLQNTATIAQSISWHTQQLQNSGCLEGGIERKTEVVLGGDQFVFRRRKRAGDITGMLGIILNELLDTREIVCLLDGVVQGT